MSQRKVAILGLGWLGTPLATALQQQGVLLIGAKRQPTLAWPFDVQAVDVAAIDAHDWTAWAEYPTWVCLLPPSCSEHYLSGLQAWLAQARHLNVQHVLYSSSISVYGDVDGVCDEHSSIRPSTDSARKVAAAENLFLSSGIKHVDIMRLGGLYGTSRHPLYHLNQKKDLSGGGRPTNMVSQQQAVAALCWALANPDGQRIRNVVAPEHPTRRAFYQAQARHLGVAEPHFQASDDDAGGKIVHSAFADVTAAVAAATV